jgi:hypothetical protein
MTIFVHEEDDGNNRFPDGILPYLFFFLALYPLTFPEFQVSWKAIMWHQHVVRH